MRKQNNPSETSKKLKTKDDQSTSILPGWPGYRTREGRSGYDPIDSRTEAAHSFATFVQRLFTAQLKTRNPVTLFVMGGLGVVLVIPLFLAISEMRVGTSFSWDAWVFLLISSICGLAALINLFKNLVHS